MTFVLEKLQILNIIGNAIGLSKNGDKYILLVWPATQQKILILMINWHKIEKVLKNVHLIGLFCFHFCFMSLDQLSRAAAPSKSIDCWLIATLSHN